MKCEYGCGKDGNFVLKNGKNCCEQYSSRCPNVKKKNSEGLKLAHKNGVMLKFSSEHRKKSNEVRISKIKELPFEFWGDKLRRDQLELDQNNKCLVCSINSWNEKPIKLELDHIDGNNSNNRRENVRLLCPNCHSQTNTFRGKNINSGKIKVSDEELYKAYIECGNVSKALTKVGLSPKGGNYNRVYKVIERLSRKG